MDIAYLGLFSKVLNWVLDKIFNPVFKFLANLLSTVFGWIFDKILGPLISSVLMPILNWLIEMVFELFAEVFYRIFAAILTLVDTMQMAFDVLIGLTPVTDNVNKTQDALLDILIQNKGISTAFLQIAFLGLGIAMLLTIFATAKSAFDLDFENKRPVGMVMRSFFKTCLNFLMVPILCLFMVKLSGVILSGINTALAQGSCTIGNTIFLTSSLDAANNSKYNTSTASDPTSVGFEDKVRKPYYEGQKSYKDVEIVRSDFKFSKFDYVVGYCMSIFILIILAMSLITFVQRIFEVIILYLISPLFVSTMPLDDGEHFKKWREMFIAKIFMGFGSAIGMRVYLMIIPIIMGNSIAFYNPALGERMSTEMTYMMKLLFVIGGAFAVWKSSSMLTTLLNFQAGQSEHASQALVGGAAVWAGHKVTSGVKGAASYMFSGSSKKDGEEKLSKREEANQRFDEISQTAAGSSGIPGVSAKSMNLVKKADAKQMALREAAGAVKANSSEYAGSTDGKLAGRIGGIKESSVGAAAGAEGGGSTAFEGGSSAGLGSPGAPGASSEAAGAGRTLTNGAAASSPKLNPKAGKTAFSLGSLKIQYNRDGKLRPSWNGKLVRFGMNKDGSSSYSVFGFGRKYNASGQKVGSKTWFTKNKFGENGEVASKTINIPLLAKLRYDKKNGVQLKSLPVIGLNRKMQANGKLATTNVLGMKFAHSVDSDGKRKMAGVQIGALTFGITGSDTMPGSTDSQAEIPAAPQTQQNDETPTPVSQTPPVQENTSPVQEEPTQTSSPVQEEPTQTSSPVQEEPTQTSSPVQEEPTQISSPVQEEPTQTSSATTGNTTPASSGQTLPPKASLPPKPTIPPPKPPTGGTDE